MEICRVCTMEKAKDDLKVTMDYLATEKLTYKSYFERFTGINYSNDANLPQNICTSCQAEINLFIIKSDIWVHNERALRRPKRKIPELANEEPPKKVVKKVVPNLAHNSFDHIRKLFSLNDKDPLKDFEEFSRVMVDQSSVEKNGEISNGWLEKNLANKKVWNEMIFECSCGSEVSSLIGYLSHQKTHGGFPKIKCPEDCNEVFTSLSSFINHIVSVHQYNYLCYCCISCGKIFYNIPALINHYESNHPNIQNLFMCVECGSYCQSFQKLTSHKNSQHPAAVNTNVDTKPELLTPVVERNDDFLLETDISFAFTDKQRLGRRSKNNKTLPGMSSIREKSPMNLNKTMRNYHGKTQFFDETSSRKTYPCTVEGCTRILVTKSGYDYHMMVHNDVKPFECDHCDKAFRSKQLKALHVRKCHENE